MPTNHGPRSVFIGPVAVPLLVKRGGTHPVHAVQRDDFMNFDRFVRLKI